MKPINFNPGTVVEEKLLRIKNDRGITSITEAIRYCVLEAYKVEYKDYIEIQKQRMGADTKTYNNAKEDRKIDSKEYREKAKAQREYDAQAAICTTLGGTITMDHLNLPVCTYTRYSMNGPWMIDESKVTDPLNMLNAETPVYQYTGLMGETGEKGKASIEAARIKISANKV